MTIIPAIDLIGGKCVRLTQGDYATQTVYSEQPLDAAKQFEDAGITRLHMVDLDGARTGRLTNLKVLEQVAAGTNLRIDYGGGIQTVQDVADVLSAGAGMVALGSVAVRHPELLEEWLLEFGADTFFVGADVLQGKIRINGWLQDGGIDIFPFVGRMIGLGVTHIFCTDIERDGVLQGPSLDLYRQIILEHPEIRLVASGGVATVSDIRKLEEAGCTGVIIGKALYEGRISLQELAGYIQHAGS